MKLSAHFNTTEFACRDRQGTPAPASHHRVLRYICTELLEPLRAEFGPCTVLSGYRTRAHNTAVGGASNSYHLYDRHDTDDAAVDIKFKRGTPNQWRLAAERILAAKRNGKGGIGYYPKSGFIHIDTRDVTSRWTG